MATPSPTSATVPDISWPITIGTGTLASISPRAMCRSVPHSPQYRDLEPDLSWTGPSQSRAPHREGARALVVDSVHPTGSHTII